MIKSIKTIMRQDREPYRVPRRVQDVIPIQCVWPDGIFKVGIKFSNSGLPPFWERGRAILYKIKFSSFAYHTPPTEKECVPP